MLLAILLATTFLTAIICCGKSTSSIKSSMKNPVTESAATPVTDKSSMLKNSILTNETGTVTDAKTTTATTEELRATSQTKIDSTPKRPSTSSTTKKEKKQDKVVEDQNLRKWATQLLETKTVKDVYYEFRDALKERNGDSKDDKNQDKIRYLNIPLVEKTRVKLKARADDYIHASRVKVPNSNLEYICTQAPMENTIEDFWWMVLQESSKFVIQLCQDVENGVSKCCKYFPASPTEEVYGAIHVKNIGKLDVQIAPSIQVTQLELKGGQMKPLTVQHIHMSDWPDQLAPLAPDGVLALYQYIKKNWKSGAVVVHCSAGVGRTSTFVGIDYARSLIANDPNQKMSDVVKEMRLQREKSVQSATQYAFLHVCLIELLTKTEIITVNEKINDFKKDYAKHTEKLLRKKQSEKV